MDNKYIINNIEYTKDEIEATPELKKELLKQLRKEHLLIYSREYAKKNRQINKEKIRIYNREYQKKRYHEDEEYRNKMKTYQNEYLCKKGVATDGILYVKLDVGRPSKYKLDDQLNLIHI
jgi:hypothetical protein